MSTDDAVVQAAAACERLERDYQPRFEAANGYVDLGYSRTMLTAEVMWNWGKTAVGPSLWTSHHFARRRLGLVGRVEQVRPISHAEAAIRRDLDDWLDRQPWNQRSRFPRLARLLGRLP